MSWIAGVDFSTFTVDTVLIDEDQLREPRRQRIRMFGGNAFDRVRGLRYALHDVDIDDVLAVGVEGIAYYGHNAVDMARVQGVIVAQLPLELRVLAIAPTDWKRRTVGRGNATKDDVREWATVQSRCSSWPQDAYDAFAIAVATLQIIEEE